MARRATAAVALTVALLALGASSALAAGPTTPPFTQCPAIGLDTACRYLIDVTSKATPPKVLRDPTQQFYDGGDDVTVGVQNDTAEPITKVHVGVEGSSDGVFGLDGDGLCSSSIEPKPSGCPFGPSSEEDPFDYYGPDTTFTIESTNAGFVNFPTPLKPGEFTYFSLEAPPSGVAIVAGEVNDTISTTLKSAEGEVENTSEPGNIELAKPANVTDSGEIQGVNAATAKGKVKWFVYEDPGCTKLLKKAGESAVVEGKTVTESEPVGLGLAGQKSYYWKAVFESAEPKENSNAESACGDEVMTFEPPPVVTTVLTGAGESGTRITVPEGTPVTDTAIVAYKNGVTPVEGQISYSAFTTSTCTGKPITVGGGGATTGFGPSSGSVTLPAGTYYFQAFYNATKPVVTHVATTCGSEVLTVTKGSPTPHPTVTSVACSLSIATAEDTCTATVGDAASSGATPPTGTVTFASSGGGIFNAGSTCSLTRLSASASSCSVAFLPPGAASPGAAITAAYGGDGTHLASSGKTPLLAAGLLAGDCNVSDHGTMKHGLKEAEIPVTCAFPAVITGTALSEPGLAKLTAVSAGTGASAAKKKKGKSKSIVVGSGTLRLTHAGKGVLIIKFTPTAQRAIRRNSGKTVHVTLKLGVLTLYGAVVKETTQSVSLSRPKKKHH